MGERKFTPPTEFPAEYVDGYGNKVVIYGRGKGVYPLIGQDEVGASTQYSEAGVASHGGYKHDLHDIPERITTWHNVYNGQLSAEDSSRERADNFAHSDRTCVYRIERDADGGNPEIFVEDV